MKKIIPGIILCASLWACNDDKQAEIASDVTPDSGSVKSAHTDVLDLSEAEGIKASFAALSKGDVDGMTANFDDNAKFFWAGGDSAVGKQAIKDYWNGRWKLIESLSFPEVIVLPVKVNETQSPRYVPNGKWVFAWTLSQVKYKNGKALSFWAHTAYYYNEAGKVVQAVQFIDRHPIMEATKGMVK
ncbi:nuclear transport factor 2 family protein [Flavitalea antarctica]